MSSIIGPRILTEKINPQPEWPTGQEPRKVVVRNGCFRDGNGRWHAVASGIVLGLTGDVSAEKQQGVWYWIAREQEIMR